MYSKIKECERARSSPHTTQLNMSRESHWFLLQSASDGGVDGEPLCVGFSALTKHHSQVTSHLVH